MPASNDSATEFELTGQRLRAAMLVADGALTDDQISKEVEVTRSSITRWRKRPEFRTKVNEFRAELEEQTLNYGIALRFKRVQVLQDLLDRLRQVIDERAADPEVQHVPGGKTGLVVRKAKICAWRQAGASRLRCFGNTPWTTSWCVKFAGYSSRPGRRRASGRNSERTRQQTRRKKLTCRSSPTMNCKHLVLSWRRSGLADERWVGWGCRLRLRVERQGLVNEVLPKFFRHNFL